MVEEVRVDIDQSSTLEAQVDEIHGLLVAQQEDLSSVIGLLGEAAAKVVEMQRRSGDIQRGSDAVASISQALAYDFGSLGARVVEVTMDSPSPRAKQAQRSISSARSSAQNGARSFASVQGEVGALGTLAAVLGEQIEDAKSYASGAQERVTGVASEFGQAGEQFGKATTHANTTVAELEAYAEGL